MTWGFTPGIDGRGGWLDRDNGTFDRGPIPLERDERWRDESRG